MSLKKIAIQQAWRNVTKHPLRTVLLLLTIAVTSALTLAVLQASNAVTTSLNSPLIQSDQIDIRGKQKYFSPSTVSRFLQHVPEIEWLYLLESNEDTSGTSIIGVARASTQKMAASIVAAGDPTDELCKTKEHLADSFFLHGTLLRITGICSGQFSEAFYQVPLAVAQQALGIKAQVSSVTVIVGSDRRQDLLISLNAATSLSSLFITESGQDKQKLQQLTAALRFNLSIMLSLIFLIAGLLIVSAYRLASLERQRDYSTLLALGMELRTVFITILAEFAIIGTLGAFLGLTVGKPLVDKAALFFMQSIAQQYMEASIAGITFSVRQVACMLVVALTLSLVGALTLLRSITKVTLSEGIRSSLAHAPSYGRPQNAFRVLGLVVAMLLLTTAATFLDVRFSFIAALFSIVVSACIAPIAYYSVMRAWRWIRKSRHNGYAPRTSVVSLLVNADLTKGWRAVALPLVTQAGAVALLFGMGIMLASFQQTLGLWVEDTLKADIFIRDNRSSTPLSIHYLAPGIYQAAAADPEVEDIIPFSFIEATVGGKSVSLAGTHFKQGPRHRTFRMLDGQYDTKLLGSGKYAIISETAANKLNKKTGDMLQIENKSLGASFQVLGIFSDYSNEQGLILIDLKALQSQFLVEGIVSAALYLKGGTDPEAFKTRLNRSFERTVTILTNVELRQSVDDIFQKTFRITKLLEWCTLALATLSFFLALLQMAAQRSQEIKTLHGLGLGRWNFFKYFVSLGLHVSAIALGAGAVGGVLLGIILVVFVNPTSFGWTLSLVLTPVGVGLPIVSMLGVNVLAALLATLASQRRLTGGVFSNE